MQATSHTAWAIGWKLIFLLHMFTVGIFNNDSLSLNLLFLVLWSSTHIHIIEIHIVSWPRDTLQLLTLDSLVVHTLACIGVVMLVNHLGLVMHGAGRALHGILILEICLILSQLDTCLDRSETWLFFEVLDLLLGLRQEAGATVAFAFGHRWEIFFLIAIEHSLVLSHCNSHWSLLLVLHIHRRVALWILIRWWIAWLMSGVVLVEFFILGIFQCRRSRWLRWHFLIYDL